MTDRQQHCDHERVCTDYLESFQNPCDGLVVYGGNPHKCKNDTRTRAPAAPATDFDCDNTICLDYKSKCGGCIPERCNYQKSLKKQKEQDHDYTIKEGVLDEMESFLDTIEQTATDPGYLDAINTMREHITESLRGGATEQGGERR